MSEALPAPDPDSQEPLVGEPATGVLPHDMTTSTEYEEICQRACKDTLNRSIDSWRGLLFVIVLDLPKIVAGNPSTETVLRTLLAFFTFALNLLFQGTLLWLIFRLLMMPSFREAQNHYRLFHEKAFLHHAFSDRLFAALGAEQNDICDLALTQRMFMRVILFLWVSDNCNDLKSSLSSVLHVMWLPRVPKELDISCMVVGDNAIVCMTRAVKFWLVTIVYIPKTLIAIVLIVCGSYWLLAAERGDDVILNSLALTFVTSIDDLFADVFFPHDFKKELADLALTHQLAGDAGTPEAVARDRLRSCIYSFSFFFLALAIVETLIYFQPILPHYSHDVRSNCVRYLDHQVPWCMPWQSSCFPMS